MLKLKAALYTVLFFVAILAIVFGLIGLFSWLSWWALAVLGGMVLAWGVYIAILTDLIEYEAKRAKAKPKRETDL